MSPSEFQNWAIVSYNDETGLGRMAQDARRVLGIGRQAVVPSRRLKTNALQEGDFLLAQGGTDALREFLGQLDGIVVLEKADWHPDLLPIARELGLGIAAVPMWEWFRADDPLWSLCDLFICPNQKCLEVLRRSGYTNVIQLPWALDLQRLPHRRITGRARLFIHNAGLVDPDDRKGTRDVIKAFRRVKNPELRLQVRMQDHAELPPLDERIELRVENLSAVSELWNYGEVAIQPSKMEGIGFTVLEPVCSGLPVITLDAAPMNEYPAGFLAQPRWKKRRAFASQWVPQAHLRLPSIRRLCAAIERAAESDLGEISRAQRAWAEEMFDPDLLLERWSSSLLPLGRHWIGSCA